jgi:prevent-host-death family protein
MDIRRDVVTVEELGRNTTKVLRSVRTNRRPMIVMSKGKPDVVIVPVKVMKDKLIALQAVCELAS